MPPKTQPSTQTPGTAPRDAPEAAPERGYRFNGFELSSSPLALTRDGERLELAPQPLRLLELLLARPGELVSREEIRRALWGEDVHVDYERGINFNIRQIRMVLGDDPSVLCFIETVPRHGYRFVAPLTGAAAQETRVPSEGREKRWRPARRPLILLACLLLGALIALVIAPDGVPDAGSDDGRDAGDLQGEVGQLPAAAVEDYRLGRRLLESPEPMEQEKAAEAFQRVLALAPAFAPAYSGLSRASLYRVDPGPARAAAAHALDVDPSQLQARYVLGWLAYLRDFDLETARSSFETVLRAEPDNAEALEAYMELLVTEGKTGEAVEVARKLLNLAPVTLRGRWAMAWALFQDRQFEASIEYAEASRELFRRRPVYPYELWMHSLIRLGRSEEAVEVARGYLTLHGWDPPPIETLDDWWRFWLLHRGEPGDYRYGDRRSRIATWHLGLGENEEALHLLREACQLRLFTDLRFLRTDPRFDPLRLDPGFQDVLACIDEPPPGGAQATGKRPSR